MKVTVTGMKSSKGTMDNGRAFDSTKVYIDTKLDESKGNQKGRASAEYALGTSAEFDKYKHLPFPFVAEVEFDQITNGKEVKTIVSSMTPVNPAKAA
jgi:hypothetical protein